MRRLIFTLLYDRGQFMLSRNFRLQAVGGLDWLLHNYDFAQVSCALDELMVLDVSRGRRDPGAFTAVVRHISNLCFIPVTVGGGVTSVDVATQYMRSGADKLLVHSAFYDDPAVCRSLADRFGRQCIVGAIDYRLEQGVRTVVAERGARALPGDLSHWVGELQRSGAGEVLLQSVDQDGSGMGLDLAVVDELRPQPEIPCVLMGGIGHGDHIVAGLQQPAVDAVATANLFNFIGPTFLGVRQSLASAGISIPRWDTHDFALLQGKFRGTGERQMIPG